MPHPDKRAALHVLTVKRLGGLCDHFQLDRAGKTRKEDFVDVLALCKRASFDAILKELKRDELRQICRAHQLSASGQEKAPLIARILRRERAHSATNATTGSADGVRVNAAVPIFVPEPTKPRSGRSAATLPTASTVSEPANAKKQNAGEQPRSPTTRSPPTSSTS